MREPASKQVDARSLVAIIDAFLEWVQTARALDTYEWYRYRLERVFADYRTTSLSLKAHPMSFHRVYLGALGVTANGNLIQDNHGKTVTVAGIVLLRQRPGTAKGITFVTIEDETGTANLIVHQQTWERFRLVARRAGAWLVHGELQAAHGVIHVIVKQIRDLSSTIRQLRLKSRDFR